MSFLALQLIGEVLKWKQCRKCSGLQLINSIAVAVRSFHCTRKTKEIVSLNVVQLIIAPYLTASIGYPLIGIKEHVVEEREEGNGILNKFKFNRSTTFFSSSSTSHFIPNMEIASSIKYLSRLFYVSANNSREVLLVLVERNCTSRGHQRLQWRTIRRKY